VLVVSCYVLEQFFVGREFQTTSVHTNLSVTDRLFVIVAPRILTDVSRSIPSNGGGGRAFPFRRLSTNTIFTYFVGFTFKLLILAQFSACLISASLLLLFRVGTIMCESLANLSILLPGVMAFRSAALTTYEAGSMLDPCMTLAVIVCNGEVRPLY